MSKVAPNPSIERTATGKPVAVRSCQTLGTPDKRHDNNSEQRGPGSTPSACLGGTLCGRVCAVWALEVTSAAIGFSSSEEPLFGFWLPGAMFGVLVIFVVGVLPNACMAWAFRRRVSVAATLIALGSIVAIFASYFVAQAKHSATWGPP